MENIKISLKAARINAEATKKQVADYMGVSIATITNWENGITEPTISQAEKIASYYRLPVNCIIFLDSKSNLI